MVSKVRPSCSCVIVISSICHCHLYLLVTFVTSSAGVYGELFYSCWVALLHVVKVNKLLLYWFNCNFQCCLRRTVVVIILTYLVSFFTLYSSDLINFNALSLVWKLYYYCWIVILRPKSKLKLASKWSLDSRGLWGQRGLNPNEATGGGPYITI